MAIDLLLGPDGDLDLSGGRVNFTNDRGIVVGQRLESRLELFLGTWFADLSAGVDWYSVLGVSKDPEDVKRLVIDALTEDPDVLSADAQVEVTARNASVTARVTLTEGETLEVSATVG
jgi:hypothetical protein